MTSEDIKNGRVQHNRVNELVSNNYHPQRSGDVYLVFDPRSYINDMDGLTVASTHARRGATILMYRLSLQDMTLKLRQCIEQLPRMTLLLPYPINLVSPNQVVPQVRC